MENDPSELPVHSALLGDDEFTPPSENLSDLSQHVHEVQSTLLIAQAHLNALGQDQELHYNNQPVDTQKVHDMYCRLPERLDLYSRVYHVWEAGESTAFEKSEVRFSLGHIKRLRVVAKNIQRISSEVLGIPNPEMQQTMLEAQLMGAGKMRFDD